jgi:hypothetical protein
VEVTATDLRVGDVVKAVDGHYYLVDTRPEQGLERDEYSSPHITFLATEVNADRTPVANSEKRTVHAEDAVLDVLTPRPE